LSWLPTSSTAAPPAERRPALVIFRRTALLQTRILPPSPTTGRSPSTIASVSVAPLVPAVITWLPVRRTLSPSNWLALDGAVAVDHVLVEEQRRLLHLGGDVVGADLRAGRPLGELAVGVDRAAEDPQRLDHRVDTPVSAVYVWLMLRNAMPPSVCWRL
jgi:hypothetical protein